MNDAPKVFGTSDAGPCCGGFRGLWFVLLVGAVGAAAIGLHYGGALKSSARIVVQTTPPGATVFVNGRLTGAAPVTLDGLQRGDYTVRIEKDGYVPLVKIVQLGASDLDIRENLARYGKGSLHIDIKPYGAEVLLDGELLGQTPLQRDDISIGSHELLIRKTNFKPYSQRIDVAPSEQLAFKDFCLEDVVLAMLRAAVETDKQRVSNYMDLGHYLFVNNEMDESAEIYAKALAVANTPIEFGPDTVPAERILEQRLRAEDMSRLNEEIRKKSHWPGKDVAKWASVLRKQQEEVAGQNPTDWNTVNEQAQNFIRDDKLERAQALLLKHISLVPKTGAMVPQAYVLLMQVRLKMHNLEGLRETYTSFSDQFGGQATLARQAANTIYSASGTFQGEPQKEVLGMAEKLLRRSVAATQKGRGDPELHALCKFELANVLTLQSRGDQAISFYQESIDGTRDASTKELRSQKYVDCLMKMKNYAAARAILTDLAKSPRPEVVKKANDDLQTVEKLIETAGPSPEQQK